jgi:hypothetical protein
MLIWAGAGLAAAAALAVGGWVGATQFVATPDYAVVRTDGDVEVRDYPALVVAEIDRPGSRGQAVRAGFGPLAGYIFARERPGEKIAMTAPVVQTAAAQGWTIGFIMPKEYALSDLPKPAQDAVTLREVPPRRRLAIRFSGVADDALLARQEARLREWAAANAIALREPPEFAYYNDPFTPGFLRRNEVIFDVAQ